jgi:tRNA(Ile)-lysidine synthase
MLSGFEKKVGNFIEANGLFGSAQRVLLAVSGGADSMALLYTMQALKSEGIIGAELVCAHINHRLRGSAADEDERFVVDQAAKLGLESSVRRVDVRAFARRNKLSIETAARELRIGSLVEIAKECNCSVIATAHQKDDNAETVVHRMLRGTGIRGLGGIGPMRVFGNGSKFARPMLCVGRREILEYLRQRGLKWREDHTNAECAYMRNYIRHRLLPALQAECTGSIVEQLSELSQSARRYYDLVCSRADAAWSGSVHSSAGSPKRDIEGRGVLDLGMFCDEAEPVKVELVRRALAAVGCGEREMTRKHYERILQLAKKNVGSGRVGLPGGYEARREYSRLVFEKCPAPSAGSPGTGRPQRDKRDAGVLAGREETTDTAVEVEIPGRTVFRQYLIEARVIEARENTEKETATKTLRHEEGELDSHLRRNDTGVTKFSEQFDLDKVRPPVMVRFRRDGDRFAPLGLGAEKKVGKFLSDARVPGDVRRKILVVADAEKVIWVWPIRMSEQAKVTERTQKVLRLQIADISGRPKEPENLNKRQSDVTLFDGIRPDGTDIPV